MVVHYKPIISNRLKQQIYYATDSLYKIDYAELHLNPFLGKLTLDSFHLIPDTATYHKLEKIHQAPSNLFDIFVDQFELRHVHLWSLIRKRHADIGVVKIENPKIIVYHGKVNTEKDKKTVKKALSKLISGSLKQVHVGHVGLHNIQFGYKNKKGSALESLELGKMDLVFEHIQLDSTTLKDTSRFLFAKNVWFHLDYGQFYTQDSLYKIDVNEVGLSLNKGKLSVNSVKIVPQKKERAFEKYFTSQKDLFRGEIKKVSIAGFHLDKINSRRWVFDSASVGAFDLGIYLDRRLPPNRSVKPLLQQTLKSIDKEISINTLAIHNGNLSYREYNPQSGETGKVTFNQIRGDIQHITNVTEEIKRAPYCTADLHAAFMDKGDLQAQFKFNLSDPVNHFTFKGYLSNMKANDLNIATEPLGMIKVNSGRIHALRYQFNANNSGAQGRVTMKYDRLKISILTKDKQAHTLKKKGLVSLAANLLVLKEGNMNDSLKSQSAVVVYKRNPQRSVFSLMWKSIFKGVKRVVGIDEEMEKKLNTALQKKKAKQKKDTSKEEGKKGLFHKIGDFLKNAF